MAGIMRFDESDLGTKLFPFSGRTDMEKYYVGLANSIVYTRYLDSFISIFFKYLFRDINEIIKKSINLGSW